MLFNEIAAELKTLVAIVEKSDSSNGTGSTTFSLVSSSLGSGNTPVGPLVFRQHSINTTLAREYFTILGRMVRHADGQALLDETDIFHNLCTIGCHPRLDYLSRVVITSLAFHDNGFMSKHLIRIWTSGSPSGDETTNSGSLSDLFQRGGQFSAGPSQTRARSASRLSAQPTTGRGRGRCSLGLRNFIYNMFGTILLSRPEDFYSWCMDAIVEMMVWEEPGNISLHLVRLLLQVVQGARGLALLIDKLEKVRHVPYQGAGSRGEATSRGDSEKSRSQKRSSASAILTGFDMTTESAYHPVLIYFLSLPEGLALLCKWKWGRRGWTVARISSFELRSQRGAQVCLRLRYSCCTVSKCILY